jgi:hypothetical protein
LQGKITLHASNVVIHTPKRDEWQWDSPLIARVGKATVECNALITVFHIVFLRREVPIEAYTIIVSDVQVFVERRESVINVYLLNPTLKLPPAPFARKSDNSDPEGTGKESTAVADKQNSNEANEASQHSRPETATTSSASHLETAEGNIGPEDASNPRLQPAEKSPTTFFDTKSSVNPLGDGASSDQDNHNRQAKALVNEMLQAVQELGGAAARGQLPGAIKRQGLELVGRLQGFRQQENLEEGIRVMQQVGKVAVESLQSAPKLILPTPDPNRERKNKIVYIRIGRIVGNDLRIFTKDSWINEAQEDFFDSTSGSAVGIQNMPDSSTLSSPTAKQINGSNSTSTNIAAVNTNIKNDGSWNRPIFIENMVLTSSELCPPISMKDENNLPAIYQSVDKVVEVVWRRVLAEIAKSNTGRLFSTAFGEVLSVMISNPQHSTSLPYSTASVTPTPGSNSNTNMGSITASI